MRHRFPFRRQVEFDIAAMTSRDCQEAARLHATGFTRPWSDGEINTLMNKSTVFGFIARPEGGREAGAAMGFVLAQRAAGEAEILTIAVAPDGRRHGMGWRLMGAVIRHLRAEGADVLFLEVDETNAAAIALYRKLGFCEVARRDRYYGDRNAAKSAALVMRLDLG